MNTLTKLLLWLIPVILLAVFLNNVSRIYFAHNLFGF